MIKKIHILILLSILALGGCATGGFSPDVVSRDAAAKSQYVQSGVVVSVRNVTIEGDRARGNLFGSVLGAIVGSNIGGEDDETTQQVGAVVGTAVGSVVGQNVGESLSRKAGVEIIIKLDTNEREISIVQEMPEDIDYSFRAGDKVRIVRSGGKARVVPYN
ncbi:MAG: glycine zipper 2TM domain-containing protein [SAR86 cluster bacterium]|jgi:outer membrane lipoprotein SlyB|nr:glycine zipper 2TM domain-containing protein [SAR86 cluster bacterium]MBL6811132.1 glycine zipper 2TM domain-containing protein [SAR86 cluster bacterium]